MKPTAESHSKPFAGQTILIVGLAREGVVAAGWLADRGARLVVSDLQSAEALSAQLATLGAITPELRLGPQTPSHLAGIDAVVASPGVPFDSDLLVAARAQGIPVTSETRLFAQQSPAPIVGITGSSGKTTTTTLTARMLQATGLHVWLGGNIGTPLLDQTDKMAPADCAVMELSSFQLLYWAQQPSGFDHLPSESGNIHPLPQPRSSPGLELPWHDGSGLSPHVAAILNITPNHLDVHPSMAHYSAAKAQILHYQTRRDVAVLNRDDPLLARWVENGWVDVEAGPGQEAMVFPLAGQIATFGLHGRPSADGAWLEEGWIWLRWQHQVYRLLPSTDVRLRGDHNLANVLAGCCLAAAGCCLAGDAAADAETAIQAMIAAIPAFTGVAHRLEVVRDLDDVLWINDSIATSPERALAAIHSFDQPLILLAGGRDKHLPWDAWAEAVHRHVRHVITFGEASELIRQALASARPSGAGGGRSLQSVETGGDLAGAVQSGSASRTTGRCGFACAWWYQFR